jgi:hypothetical protein
MRETLLAESSVWLFGRIMTDIVLNKDEEPNEAEEERQRPGPRGVLASVLRHDAAALARIYMFAFEGELFELRKPAIFLVHGEGKKPSDRRKLSEIGLPFKREIIASDLRVWVYDRDDMTLRLDQLTGTFDRLLLDHEIGREGLQDYVRGGNQAGSPSPLGPSTRRGRGRRWRADDE